MEKSGRYCVFSSFIASGFFAQIAIAIGVLTSNRGEANHFGGLDVAPGRYCRAPSKCAIAGQGDEQLWGSGAIAGCHCSSEEGRVTTNFGGVDVVPLLGAHAQQWHPDKQL